MLPREAQGLNIAVSVYYDVLLVRGLEATSRHGIVEVKSSQWRGLRTWRYRLADLPGGYELILWDTRRGALRSARPPALTAGWEAQPLEFDEASFLIRYYPTPDEPFFENFSAEEQALRLSEVFENGASTFPVEGYEDRLSEFHFNVGTMMLAAGVFHSVVRLSLMSQERFVSVVEDGLKVHNEQLIEPGGVDRNVPGWQLSWFLFSKILKIYVEKLGVPYLVVERGEPGRIWVCRESGCREQQTNDYILKTLELVFIPEKDDVVVKVIEENLLKIGEILKAEPQNEKLIPYLRILWRREEENIDEKSFWRSIQLH